MAALTEARRATFWAAARRILAGADPERESVVDGCERLLAGKPRSALAGLSLYLSLLRWLPALTRGRSFERLDAQGQDEVLASLQSHPVRLIRVGFWGVRTLALLAHYGRPEVGRDAGYRPPLDGNAELLAERR